MPNWDNGEGRCDCPSGNKMHRSGSPGCISGPKSRRKSSKEKKLIEYLKNNLKIHVNLSCDTPIYDSYLKVNVSLTLGDENISDSEDFVRLDIK